MSPEPSLDLNGQAFKVFVRDRHHRIAQKFHKECRREEGRNWSRQSIMIKKKERREKMWEKRGKRLVFWGVMGYEAEQISKAEGNRSRIEERVNITY